MGISSSAHLIFGQSISPPDEAFEGGVYEWLEDKLPSGGPLQFFVGGGYDWPDEERPVFITLRDVDNYRADEGTTDVPADLFRIDPTPVVYGRKLFKHLQFGPEFEPKWHLVASEG